MLKAFIKKITTILGIDIGMFLQMVCKLSIKAANIGNENKDMLNRLRLIVPDISRQHFHVDGFNEYWELKGRGLHAFQCLMMLKVIKTINKKQLTVVDIGDSAGTHMKYLKELTGDEYKINTVSVNLDSRAIEKIKAQGQEQW